MLREDRPGDYFVLVHKVSPSTDEVDTYIEHRKGGPFIFYGEDVEDSFLTLSEATQLADTLLKEDKNIRFAFVCKCIDLKDQ